MALGYFVYYRIEPARAGQARGLVEHLFEQLHQACGVRGRLLTKRDDPDLWMEIYEPVIDGARFDTIMRTEQEALRFSDVLLAGSKRSVECFED
jgi:hypothetical protein